MDMMSPMMSVVVEAMNDRGLGRGDDDLVYGFYVSSVARDMKCLQENRDACRRVKRISRTLEYTS